MRETTLSSAELRFLVLLLGFLALAMSGAILHTRHEWKALKHKLFKPHDGLVKSSRPGRIAERLSSAGWDSAFRETLEKARRDLASTGRQPRRRGRGSGRGGRYAREDSRLRRPSGDARGELQSAVPVRIDKAIVYVLVFPGRHDDRRVGKRSKPLSEEVSAPAAAVRRAAGGGGSARPWLRSSTFSVSTPETARSLPRTTATTDGGTPPRARPDFARTAGRNV